MIDREFKAAITKAGAAYREITCFGNADFRDTLVFKNIDLSDATFASQIRHLPGNGGAPLADITMGDPVFALGDTTVTMSLDRVAGVLGGLPAAPETGKLAEFAWDSTITWNGIVATFVAGHFTVVPGSTQV